MSTKLKILIVELGDKSYPIYIGRDLLSDKTYLEKHISGQQVMVVTNSKIEPLYLDKVKNLLGNFQVQVTILPDGEQYKTLETVNSIFDALLEAKFDRSTTLIALGGGVIGDMVGFAAACYQRGVDFIQVPTTLLAQVDSSVGGKTAANAGAVINELANLHFSIWDELFEAKILPHAGVRHALSSAVGSPASVDVNLKLFDLIGRLAMRGLWIVWELSPATGPVLLDDAYLTSLPEVLQEANLDKIKLIDRLCHHMMQIVSNNRALLSPVADWQAIDIALAFTLLASRPNAHGAIDEWAEELAKRSIFAFNVHGRYPITSHSYWDLVEHPSERSEEYRKANTEGSILFPMLALWAAARGKRELLDEIAKFKSEALEHCTFQTWLPSEDSEANLYLGRHNHGAALTGIPVTTGTSDTLYYVLEEARSNTHFDDLSAVRLGHWVLVPMACRSQRLPIPPQLWRELLLAVGTGKPDADDGDNGDDGK